MEVARRFVVGKQPFSIGGHTPYPPGHPEMNELRVDLWANHKKTKAVNEQNLENAGVRWKGRRLRPRSVVAKA